MLGVVQEDGLAEGDFFAVCGFGADFLGRCSDLNLGIIGLFCTQTQADFFDDLGGT